MDGTSLVQRLGPCHTRSPASTITRQAMGDLLVPIAPLIVAGASTFPAFHILREFAKVVLKPIVPHPSKTIPQLTQSTPSTSSTTLNDDGPWFPTSFFGTVRAPAFTPKPTPFDTQSMLPQAAAPEKNLDHLPNVLSSDPARAMMVFIFIVASYLFIQFFARYIQLRRRFSPVTHTISAAITVYLYTLTGSASHYSLLSIPVTLHQAKESALPVACATLATFSVFNMVVSVVESIFRNVLAGIQVSAIPNCVCHSPPHFFDLCSLFYIGEAAPTGSGPLPLMYTYGLSQPPTVERPIAIRGDSSPRG